jgi:hypothetical protein
MGNWRALAVGSFVVVIDIVLVLSLCLIVISFSK